MNSSARKILLVGSIMIGPILVLFWPDFAAIGPVLLLIGFCLIVATGLYSTFRRSPLGPFALYKQPKEYLAMKFTDRERLAIRLSSHLAFGGALAMLIEVLRAW